MKRAGILNQELSRAIAAMGHGDILMIVDAGFPIPATAWRIDLAIVPGVPDLATLYAAIAPELIVEKVMFAAELAEHNAPLLATLKRWFDERDFAPVGYEETVGPLAARAKAIVRSGALDPWGNVALVSGIDASAYFDDPRVGVPPRYRALIDRPAFAPGR
jgi:D-ribose pyranase